METSLLWDCRASLTSTNRPTIEQIAATLAAAGLGTVTLDELQWAAIENALFDHGGNRTHAARALGISVRTLQRRLRHTREYDGDATVVE